MFEELMTAEEGTVVTSHKKIRKAILEDEDPAVLKQQYEKLVTLQGEEEIITLMQQMIPTYKLNHDL